jgi:hypothetical protein
MKTFKFIILAFATVSIFNALPVVAETNPMKAVAKVKQIYPPFLIFDEGGEVTICTTKDGIKDGDTIITKHGTYNIRGNGILGPNGWYNIRSSDISSPSGKWYSWSEDSVGEYKIQNNEIYNKNEIYIINSYWVDAPNNEPRDCSIHR